jgi:fructose-1,6-bisphosphatase/inositol monophosphatase family enzyme
VQEVMDEYVRKFVANMNTAQMAKPRWKNEPEGKQQAKKAYADTATSVDDIVEEVIRRSYPNYKPGDSVTEDYVAPWDKQSRGDKVRFRIPAFKDKKTDDLDKDNKEKAAREALRRRSQGQ